MVKTMKALYGFGLAMLAAGALLSSCSKAVNSEAKLDDQGRGTVLLSLAIDDNQFKKGQAAKEHADYTYPGVPEMTVTAVVKNPESLGAGKEQKLAPKLVTISGTDASLELPVGPSGTTYEISFPTVIAKYTEVKADGSEGSSYDATYKYKGGTPLTVSILPGQIQHFQVKYEKEGRANQVIPGN